MDINNNSIANAAHTAQPQPTQSLEQAGQHNDPLIHIVLTQAGRAVHFIAGMVGSFFNAHLGPVDLSEVELVTNHPSIEKKSDDDSDYCPQTPNPEMYLPRSDQTETSIPQTPNPLMYPSRSDQTQTSIPKTPNTKMFPSC